MKIAGIVKGLSPAFLTWETSVMLFMWSVLKQIRGGAAWVGCL